MPYILWVWLLVHLSLLCHRCLGRRCVGICCISLLCCYCPRRVAGSVLCCSSWDIGCQRRIIRCQVCCSLLLFRCRCPEHIFFVFLWLWLFLLYLCLFRRWVVFLCREYHFVVIVLFWQIFLVLMDWVRSWWYLLMYRKENIILKDSSRLRLLVQSESQLYSRS